MKAKKVDYSTCEWPFINQGFEVQIPNLKNFPGTIIQRMNIMAVLWLGDEIRCVRVRLQCSATQVSAIRWVTPSYTEIFPQNKFPELLGLGLNDSSAIFRIHKNEQCTYGMLRIAKIIFDRLGLTLAANHNKYTIENAYSCFEFSKKTEVFVKGKLIPFEDYLRHKLKLAPPHVSYVNPITKL